MSSLKMTFSLTSLILIIALGLVFVSTSVMAHAPNYNTADPPVDSLGHAAGTVAGDGHMHPKITITADDANEFMDGTQIVDSAADDTSDPVSQTERQTLQFEVKVTVPAGATENDGTTAIAAATTIAAEDISVVSFDSNFDPVGTATATIGTIALAENVFTVPVTITITDPAGSPTVATTNKLRSDAIAAGLYLRVTIDPIIESGKVAGALVDQDNVETRATFTVIAAKVTTAPTVKVPFKITGTASVTDDFTVTFTADEAAATLTQANIDVMGGTIINFGKVQFPPDGTTVYEAVIRPTLHTRKVTVTIKSSASTAKPAAAPNDKVETSIGEATITGIAPVPAAANDQADFEVYFTFDRELPSQSTPMLEHLSIGTMASDMMDGDEANDTVTGATDPMFLGTPNRVPGESMKWRVTVSPKSGSNTIIGLSTAGMDKFTYGSGVKALTVMRQATTVRSGDIGATLSADKTSVTLSGAIAANGFAVVGADSLPDLEAFFFVGGTIGLDDGDGAADENSRSVVISEILWGLDLGAPVASETRWQFIELYNTTNAAIDLTGWMLKFTEGRPVPASDIDQVSNRKDTGWTVDIGQSGRVTGTRADNVEGTITPVRIVSMYRNINYDKVEKVKADGTADPSREEQLKGIPGGNAKGSWKASSRHTTNRWIYDSRGRKHATSSPIITASPVARSPFVINEIGNGSDDEDDWVELRNVTSSEASLKNYHLSIVTAVGTDNSLVNFHDKDVKVPGNSVILLVNTDPSNTDLAGGINAQPGLTVDDQEKKGATHLYYVDAGLKLPSDGKFNLILRNAHDKLKASSHFIDAVGMQKLEDQSRGTHFWPVSGAGAPHGNVNENGDEVFKSGIVYIRKNAGGGTGEKHWGQQGYTGVGYDRTASNSAANGGTPGYDNGAKKEKVADLSAAGITISEIMVDTGSARSNLPQWIEIYNSSMTQAVDLNGWKLMIENAADEEVSTFNATLTLKAMTISPNQTVLIASTSGRTSDADHFPNTRVVNLWTTKDHRTELEMVRRTDQVISANGFHLKLIDKDNKTVDMAGNLDGNRRTRDEPAWAIPMSEEEGRRSSLIRVYDDGIAIDGETAGGWVLASDTDLAFAISHTFYGDADDFGTPGYRGGGPLPVSLSKFRPTRLDTGEVVIRWATESELNNAGFNILRSTERNGEFTKVNTSLIAGHGTTSERNTYEWKDTSAKPNVVYYYQIQDVSLDGEVNTLRQSRLKGDVSPAGKLTVTWGELKALQ